MELSPHLHLTHHLTQLPGKGLYRAVRPPSTQSAKSTDATRDERVQRASCRALWWKLLGILICGCAVHYWRRLEVRVCFEQILYFDFYTLLENFFHLLFEVFRGGDTSVTSQ